MRNEVQTAVESAKQAQARALDDLNEAIEEKRKNLQETTFKDDREAYLAHEEFAGMLRARHFLTHGS